jgi:hypothetical protein
MRVFLNDQGLLQQSEKQSRRLNSLANNALQHKKNKGIEGATVKTQEIFLQKTIIFWRAQTATPTSQIHGKWTEQNLIQHFF